jgi:hypothetical protein
VKLVRPVKPIKPVNPVKIVKPIQPVNPVKIVQICLDQDIFFLFQGTVATVRICSNLFDPV